MKNLYVIYDTIGEETGPVFESVNDGVALRAREQMLKEVPEKYQDSFQLLYIGAVNDKGILTPCNPVKEVKANAEII